LPTDIIAKSDSEFVNHCRYDASGTLITSIRNSAGPDDAAVKELMTPGNVPSVCLVFVSIRGRARWTLGLAFCGFLFAARAGTRGQQQIRSQLR
jgi:hypothetical protein